MTLAADKLTNANVALFANGAYVDNDEAADPPPASSEVKNIKASLKSQGHDVSTFTAISAAGLAAALAGQDVLVIPELEVDDLAGDLAPDAAEVIRDFVATGHTLVIHGASSDKDTDFLNSVFGFTVGNGGTLTGVPLSRGGGAAGTAFANDPLTINGKDETFSLDNASLPSDAVSIYSDNGDAGVVVFSYFGGQIVFLGWDWFNAKPRGNHDGGWLKVLDSAISSPDGPGAEISGTSGNDIVNATETVSGEPMPTIRNDDITGGSGEDTLSGLAGNDRIAGGNDADTLRGGKGRDKFIFDSGDVLASFDDILDFKVGKDTIVLDPQQFAGLPQEEGPLAASAFHVEANATKAGHRIIYNDGNGKLFYDEDGNGAGVKVQFAQLDAGLDLSHKDFDLVLFP